MPISISSRSMTPLLFGAIGGFGAGAILFLLSHLAPRMGAGTFVRDLDQVCILGHDCSRREAHLIGAALHLGLSIIFGAAYVYAANQGMVTGFRTLPLALYALLLTIFMGGIVLPLEGHGLFGFKEDAWFPADLLITNALWVLLFGLFMTVLV
jgi:hypothetical protein